MTAPLATKLQQDLTNALKAREVMRVGILRLLVAALTNARIEKRADLAEEECVGILRREAKKRREAISFYAAEHPDRAAAEQAELDIIATYVPQQLDAAAIRAVAQKHIQAASAAGPADFRKVMPIVMRELKGAADGAEVRAVVTELLRGQPA